MKKVIKLTESDLVNIIKKVVRESGGVKDKFKNSPYNPKMEGEELEFNEGSSEYCSKCFSMGKQCCHKGTGNPKCCDYCGENDSCGTRIKV